MTQEELILDKPVAKVYALFQLPLTELISIYFTNDEVFKFEYVTQEELMLVNPVANV